MYKPGPLTYDFREYNSVVFDIYEPNINKTNRLTPSSTFPDKYVVHLGKLNSIAIQNTYFHFFIAILFRSKCHPTLAVLLKDKVKKALTCPPLITGDRVLIE